MFSYPEFRWSLFNGDLKSHPQNSGNISNLGLLIIGSQIVQSLKGLSVQVYYKFLLGLWSLWVSLMDCLDSDQLHCRSSWLVNDELGWVLTWKLKRWKIKLWRSKYQSSPVADWSEYRTGLVLDIHMSRHFISGLFMSLKITLCWKRTKLIWPCQTNWKYKQLLDFSLLHVKQTFYIVLNVGHTQVSTWGDLNWSWIFDGRYYITMCYFYVRKT